jgi:hypothetical protein
MRSLRSIRRGVGAATVTSLCLVAARVAWEIPQPGYAYLLGGGMLIAWLLAAVLTLALGWRAGRQTLSFKLAFVACASSAVFGITWIFFIGRPITAACIESQYEFDSEIGQRRSFWCPPPEIDGRCRFFFNGKLDNKLSCGRMWSQVPRCPPEDRPGDQPADWCKQDERCAAQFRFYREKVGGKSCRIE